MTQLIEARLTDGAIVSGKLYHGEIVAKTYANRTQATKAKEKLGNEWAVFRGRYGRAFYVVKLNSLKKWE